MSTRAHRLAVTRSARVVTQGDPRAAEEIWFLLHGYGQLASALLDDCRALESPERLLVAPEALSRFYVRGGSGAIGASWMTRAERAAEIGDYVAYLDDVARWTERELGCRAQRRTVFGFSQGAATAWRWAALGETRFERLIAWGGAVPSEIPLAERRARFAAIKLQSVRGSRDPLYDEPLVARDRERLTALGLQCEFIEFAGAHEIDAGTLARLSNASRAP